MADKPLDIFGQYRFLDPSIFGTNFNEFKKRYCNVSNLHDDPQSYITLVDSYKEDMTEEFLDLFYSIGIVIKSEDVQDLPETQHIYRYAKLSKDAQRLYIKLEKEFIAFLREEQESHGHIEATNVLSQMTRLHQITSGLAVYQVEAEDTVFERHEKEIDTKKRELLQDVLTDLDVEEPVVVFYRYNHDLKNIKKVCKNLGRSLSILNSKHKENKEFQYDKKTNTIAVNIRSGGAGINLTRAKYHIFYTVGLSNADYRQALKRGHRYDEVYQHPTVYYYHLVIPNTIDEDIKNKLDSKGNLVDSLIRSFLNESRKDN